MSVGSRFMSGLEVHGPLEEAHAAIVTPEALDFDLAAEIVSGGTASTLALAESTEAAQVRERGGAA
jgi:hypothetical protein